MTIVQSQLKRISIRGQKLTKQEITLIQTKYNDHLRNQIPLHKIKKLIADDIRISIPTIGKYLNRSKEPKSGRPKYSGKSTDKHILQFIRKSFEIMSTLYLEELQESIKEVFGIWISISQLSKVKTQHLNITHKKVELLSNYRLQPHIQLHRKLYRELIIQFDVDDLFFIDESTVTFNDLARRYGHSVANIPAVNSSHHVSNKRYSLIACINNKVGVVYSEVIDTTSSGVNQDIFGGFMLTLKYLMPRGKICVMDNSTVHSKEGLISLMKEKDIEVLFQSRYSPDYNPIEYCFSWLKSNIKKDEYTRLALDFHIKTTFDSLPLKIVQQYIKYAQSNWRSTRV